jgi:hypothetical protein
MSTPRDDTPRGRNLALEPVPLIEAAALQQCDQSIKGPPIPPSETVDPGSLATLANGS